jgi:leucyl/phenylalanyl-tRNA--protein transferase
MPLFALPDDHIFPDPELARDDGLLAVGGDLHPARLLLAYSQGIFPWYSEGQPILWHSPDPRFVLFLDEFEIPRSLRREVRKGTFEVRADTAFAQVVDACSRVPRVDQDGTWITDEMRDAYVTLHEMGFAHSVESWLDGALVGGLYGVGLGGVFFGESMFALESNASKVAFVHLVHQLKAWDCDLLDSQVHTEHLARFGGRNIPRRAYLDLLSARLQVSTRRGPWTLDPLEARTGDSP